MNVRRSFLWSASAALTIFLVVLFFKVSKLDFRVTIQQLRSVSWVSFATLVLLTTFHVYLSSLKWRCVDARLRRPADSAPSKTMSFALTSMGVALGQLFPCNSACRLRERWVRIFMEELSGAGPAVRCSNKHSMS
jgi:uncharacterized membrane protein YbhN (UPF0104 family)